MTPQEMWNAYKQINPSIGDEIDAWTFGVEADTLAGLVLKGEKTATASAYDLYALEDEPLPQKGPSISFRQSRSGCLYCRNYKGLRSAFSSSFC